MTEKQGWPPEGQDDDIDNDLDWAALESEEDTSLMDPTGAYITSSTREPLLKGIEEETELAKAIEAGVFARRIREVHDEQDETVREELMATTGITRAILDKYAADPEARADLDALITEGDAAFERMINANTRWAIKLASRSFPERNESMGLTDMAQEGMLGLIRATQKFDYTKGFKFSTYATAWVQQTMIRGRADFDKTVRFPVHMEEAVRKVSHHHRRLSAELQREPTDDELAARTGLSAVRAREMLERQRIFRNMPSLNKPLRDADGTEAREFGDIIDRRIEDDASPESSIEMTVLKEELGGMLARLGEKERTVVMARFGFYGEPETLKQAGDRLGLTRERARQLEAAAMLKLQKYARSRNLD